MMSTSTQSPRLGYPVGSGSSAAPTLWDTGDTASPGGPPRLEDGAGGSNASGPQADPIDLTSTGDGGGLERTLSVDEVLDQLSSAPRDAHCLAMLDELASLGGLTLKQQVRLVGLYRQVSTACDGKAADLSARLFECHGKTEGDRRALVDWIARATSSTHGDAARLTQVGQARQATPELKQSMDAGGTSLQGAAALVGETKNLSSQAASQVIGTVIGQGPGRNPAELRQAARVQVEQAHQDTAVERHAKAMRQRHVSVTPAADGMSWLRAYVASTDATVVSSALARQARSQPAAGRSLANVEADLLVDYLHQAIDQADQTGRTS
ncbi:MAG: 13E12 repeat family protein, partial [Micrococcales bacterium]|nr:13E12 repeat family protein [Micrococcales bacterium]